MFLNALSIVAMVIVAILLGVHWSARTLLEMERKQRLEILKMTAMILKSHKQLSEQMGGIQTHLEEMMDENLALHKKITHTLGELVATEVSEEDAEIEIANLRELSRKDPDGQQFEDDDSIWSRYGIGRN